jgi:hypothetical protein
MNEHLPPPRRSIPTHELAAMRDRLRREMGGPSPQSGPTRSRLLAPARAAAAAMAVVAVGGYVSLGGGGESPGSGGQSPGAGFATDGTTIAPPLEEGGCAGIAFPADEPRPAQTEAGPGGGTVGLEPDESVGALPEADAPAPGGSPGTLDDPPVEGPPQCEVLVPAEPGRPTSTEVAHPGPVFERCDQLVHERFPDAGATTGRLAIENGAVRTAVLSAGPTTYLCHLGPDIEQVSKDGTHTSGRHVWAGGELPPDATGMGVTMVDRVQTYRAVVRDGWWALQGVEDEPIGDDVLVWTEQFGGDGELVSGSTNGELCSEDDPDC